MNKDEEMRAKQLAGMQAANDSELAKMQEQEQKRQEMEEQRRVLIRQLLDAEALERLNRVGLVKPEKRQQIEAAILGSAQSGQITEKLSDGALIKLIEKVDAATKPAGSTGSVKFHRKQRADSDDDIDLDNL
mmetsp:Transcript_56217/g.130976  ORF Transcript_56217/g.130976 Transcript_56217/m.130976 type:complete len:132 (+) Transcript_56217:123-518(+)|eukprot:CAMPEP_0171109868 /NCGR_PEP_ID=MMETSP0766_2-20121228/71030_1 /TAXON_ID=439317 /ORGANISM="Gambierdiscus australes, Strain CAWD 149" /LENGTH=131 /DNA_ID=CAMNT_0011571669 /DNA_START=48 /DNA_END=443 /DNA_ORIENTATION=-